MAQWPKHFDGQRYFNPGSAEPRGFQDFLRWQLTSRPDSSPEFVDDVEPRAPSRAVTFVNHSTVLLRIGNLNILTDPIWAERASPLDWIGPKRRRKPGVLLEQLPPIDVILLSHDHYDHLDTDTLRWLAARDHSQFIVPLGVSPVLRQAGISATTELDWGQVGEIGELLIHSVPAVHFSGRGLFDRNQTLWCGYVIQSPHALIYFAGDTAFGEHFASIRAEFGAPDLALLPIGAYEPRWFMKQVHMSPQEAIEAHRVLEARQSVAIHHGTFPMADDGIDTARAELMRCNPPDSFLVLRNGESIDLP